MKTPDTAHGKQWDRDFAVLMSLVLYAVAVHASLLVYDLFHPDVFLNADRAVQRFHIIDVLLPKVRSINDLVTFVSEHGIVGDYFFHAVLYAIVGQYGVITAQLLLLLISLAALFHLVLLITRSRLTSAIAVLLYVHLPHTLVFPHQLVSEAVFNPLIIVSFYYLARYIFEHTRVHYAMASALMLGLATIVRPVSALWSLIAASMMLATDNPAQRAPRWASYVLVSLLPLALWMFFIFATTGTFSMGSSKYDIAHNLYSRVERMISTLPADQHTDLKRHYLENTEGKKVLSVSQYLRFAIDHPYAYITHFGRDALVFGVKSGVNRIVLDYFDSLRNARGDLQHWTRGWRRTWEEEGAFNTLTTVAQKYPFILLITVTGSVLWMGFLFLALLGALHTVRRFDTIPLGERTFHILLMLFPVYLFFASHAVNAMQSRHRAPAEFALCIFVALAIHGWIKRKGAA